MASCSSGNNENLCSLSSNREDVSMLDRDSVICWLTIGLSSGRWWSMRNNQLVWERCFCINQCQCRILKPWINRWWDVGFGSIHWMIHLHVLCDDLVAMSIVCNKLSTNKQSISGRGWQWWWWRRCYCCIKVQNHNCVCRLRISEKEGNNRSLVVNETCALSK